jgi:hypothetical protein
MRKLTEEEIAAIGKAAADAARKLGSDDAPKELPRRGQQDPGPPPVTVWTRDLPTAAGRYLHTVDIRSRIELVELVWHPTKAGLLTFKNGNKIGPAWWASLHQPGVD